MTNTGDTTISDGDLHLITDGRYWAKYNFATLGITVDPNEELILTITISDTYRFVGDVPFTVFFTDVGEPIHDGSKYEEILTFDEHDSGYSGIPMYSIQHKDSISSNPALNVRWSYKADPNRDHYALSYRKVGDPSWTRYIIPSQYEQTGLFVSPFDEDTKYEARLETKPIGLSFYLAEQPVEVRTSSDDSEYLGTIQGDVSIAGYGLSSVDLFGYNVSTTTASDGSYSISNARSGSSAIWVDEVQYEEYKTIFVSDEDTVTGVDVFTNLKTDNSVPTTTAFELIGESDYIVPNKDDHLIYIAGSDDVGIASASFFYMDENVSTTTWNLIGSTEILNNADVSYTWYIPETLIGENYKLKGVIYDFSGKAAEDVYWGPFEIIEGNAVPEFDFLEPELSENIAIDGSYTIQWTDNDPDSDASIALYYDTDTNYLNGRTEIVSSLSEDSNFDQYEWDSSGVAEGTYYLHAVVSDGVNGALIRYSLGTVTVGHSSPLAPTALLTEGQTNPTDLVDNAPEFSAIYSDPNSGDNAIGYRVQVSASSTSWSTLQWDSAKTAMSTTTDGNRSSDISYGGSVLASSTAYYWRIKFWDDEDNEGAWSTTTASFSLEVVNATATPPTSLLAEEQTNPVNLTDPTPEFSAIYNDPDTGDRAVSYKLQVSTSTDFTSPYWDSTKKAIATTTEGNRTPDISYGGSALASSTTYYWRIKLWDDDSVEGDWSTTTATFSLSSGNNAPTAPTALETEGQTNPIDIDDDTPEFSAIYNDPDSEDIADYYQIQVSTSSDFSLVDWDSTKTALASSTPKGNRIADISYGGSALASSTTHYWRIKFWDDENEEGAWSTSTSTFSLAAAVGGGPIFSDTFTEASDTALPSHTPDVGTGWTLIDTSGSGSSGSVEVHSSSDTLRGAVADASAGAMYSADTTYNSADYQVKFTLTAAPTSDEYLGVGLRMDGTAANGYLFEGWWGDNHDPAIYRVSNGSFTQLGNYDSTDGIIFGNGDTVIAEVSGNELTMFTADDIGHIYVSDSTHTLANKASLGYGAYRVSGGDISTTIPIVDDFEVIELAATTTGWNSPSTTGEVDNDWVNPSNAYSSDNSRVTIDADTHVGTGAQDYGDFGFSIDSGDTIKGIEVRAESLTDSSGYHDLAISVSKDNGSTWSSEKTIRYEDFDASDGTKVAGHAFSLWGLSWSPSDLSDTNFRVRVRLAGRESTGVDNLGVDHLSVKVFHD